MTRDHSAGAAEVPRQPGPEGHTARRVEGSDQVWLDSWLVSTPPEWPSLPTIPHTKYFVNKTEQNSKSLRLKSCCPRAWMSPGARRGGLEVAARGSRGRTTPSIQQAQENPTVSGGPQTQTATPEGLLGRPLAAWLPHMHPLVLGSHGLACFLSSPPNPLLPQSLLRFRLDHSLPGVRLPQPCAGPAHGTLTGALSDQCLSPRPGTLQELSEDVTGRRGAGTEPGLSWPCEAPASKEKSKVPPTQAPDANRPPRTQALWVPALRAQAWGPPGRSAITSHGGATANSAESERPVTRGMQSSPPAAKPRAGL